MFSLLVKNHIRGLWNTASRSAQRNRLVSAGLTLFGIILFGLVYIGFHQFLALSRGVEATRELIYEIFFFLFLFLLAGAVPFVASPLLHSSDYLLLLAAPLRPRAIIAAKLLDATVTNSLQFTVIGIPAIAACGSALHLPFAWWPYLLILTLLFVLLPALATALVLLIALWGLGMRRVRAAIATVNLIMAAVVCLTIVGQINRLPIRTTFASFSHSGGEPSGTAGAPFHHARMTETSPAAHYSPSGWFARSLLAVSEGRTASGMQSFLVLLASVGALFLVCTWLGERLLFTETVGEEGETSFRAGVVSTNTPVTGYRRGPLTLFSSPVAALIAKDLRYVLRDSVLLGQLGMPLILFLVPYVLAMQDTFRTIASSNELYFVSLGMTGFILFMQTSILSLSSIGMESRSFWLSMVSPNGGGTILWAKFVMSTTVSGGVSACLTLLNGLMFRVSLWGSLGAALGVLVVAAALCGMGVGISAALPRFIYENPAHRVSPWALIIGFFATAGYLMIVLVLAVVTYIIADQIPEYTLATYAVSLLLFLLASFFSALFPMLIGARRLASYQWTH